MFFSVNFFVFSNITVIHLNEKMKIEESIKKGKEHYEESLQRALDAEVSPQYSVTDKIRQGVIYLPSLITHRQDSIAGTCGG